jgi:hypothetical protein
MRRHHAVVAFGAYLLLAVAAFWPLPRHLSTHLPGPPSGDTGVYVWNLWVFQHELLDHGRIPLSTSKVFSLLEPVDLSQHNYTPFADTLAVPLVPVLGVVTTYNLLLLLFVALNGWALYLLARVVSGRALESWVAGAAFALSPVLVARSTAHFSLVAAFPLPLVLLFTLRCLRTGRRGCAWAMGALVAVSAMCDAYYGVYAAMLVGVVVAAHLVAVHWHRREPHTAWARGLDGVIAGLLGLIAGLLLLGGRTFQVLGTRIAVQTLYTPVLVCTVAVLVRLALVWRPRITLPDARRRATVLRFTTVAAVVAAALLSPTLIAMTTRAVQGAFESPAVHWRTSPPGVDLLAFVMPNPNHRLFGAPFRAWITRERPDGFAELTGALPLVVLATVLVVSIRRRREAPRLWLGLAAGTAALAIGPFLHVAGVNTYVPGPWALLRYVPVLGLARSPSRFAVLVTLAMAVLFAWALARVRETPRGRFVAWALIGILAFELCPAPRPLAAAKVPRVYDVIKADPDHSIRVLQLPTGIRDGASSLGDFNPESQFLQTYHEKRLVGGYLSRVSKRRKRNLMSFPVTSALVKLSEGRPLTREEEYLAWRHRGRFLRRSRLAYVVMDTSRTTPELRRFAIDLFDLQPLMSADGRELFTPRSWAVAGRLPPGWDADPFAAAALRRE